MIEFVVIVHVTHHPDITESRDIVAAIRDHKIVNDASLVRRGEHAIVISGHFKTARWWQPKVSYRQQMMEALRRWRPVPIHALDVLVRGAHEMDPTISAITTRRHHLVSDLGCLGIRV